VELELKERDFTEVVKKALDRDTAGVVAALVSVAVGGVTSHPLAGVLAGKLTTAVTSLLEDPNTKRFLNAGDTLEAQREATAAFRRLLSDALRPMVVEFADQYGEQIDQLRRYLERNLASAEGQEKLIVGQAELLLGQGQILDELRNARPKSPTPLPRFPGTLPPIWNITQERNPYFTGRDQELTSLHSSLTQGHATALTQAVKGLGGVGKSQLALEYAYRYAGDYEGIWWLGAESSVTLARDYVELAPYVGVGEHPEQAQTVREVRRALSQRDGILLIFDNAADPTSLHDYLPTGPRRRVIVTTRAHYWPGAQAQDVNELPLQAAIEFLLKRSEESDRAAAENIAKRLGRLPLALDQAAAYVAACETTLHQYATLLEQHGLDLLEQGQPHQYEKTVGTTWDIAFKRIQESCPAATDLLNLCAFLAPDAIPLRDFAEAKAHLPERLADTLADELEFNQAKRELLNFSLIRAEGDLISIHRLVQDVTRKRLAPEAHDSWLSAGLCAVNALFPDESHDVRNGPTCARWLAHALALVTQNKAEQLEADACARLRNLAGLLLRSQADYVGAEPQFRRALEILQTSLGPDHPQVATALNNLASLLQDTNRLADAEPLFRRALAIDEPSLGPNHPSVATRLNNLALLLKDTNRLADAEPLFRRALEILQTSLGPDHPNTRTCQRNLELLREQMTSPVQ